jgi:hypothetical protein
MDWADKEPSAAGNCAVADKALGYNIYIKKHFDWDRIRGGSCNPSYWEVGI